MAADGDLAVEDRSRAILTASLAVTTLSRMRRWRELFRMVKNSVQTLGAMMSAAALLLACGAAARSASSKPRKILPTGRSDLMPRTGSPSKDGPEAVESPEASGLRLNTTGGVRPVGRRGGWTWITGFLYGLRLIVLGTLNPTSSLSARANVT